MKRVTILGSTGSIGVNTLDVISRNPERYRVFALTANHNIDLLLQQCIKFKPDYAVLVDTTLAKNLAASIKQEGLKTEVLAGVDGLAQVAGHEASDYVMAAIVGAAGLLPTLAAAKSGKRVLLANKEALVMSGKLFMDAVQHNNAELLPIDSEHNAIFQCMPAGGFDRGLKQSGIRKILITASGGPFRTTPVDKLIDMTPAQACAHPNWVMGRKISVDSATMMNKGLEVIEACWLFGTTPDYIEVVLHPQSVIHSMVEYLDGSVLAQLGNPDMRTPIAHAMAWPERIESGVQSLDLIKTARLDFENPDYQRFPCLRLARNAMQQGGTATAILNAANEVAVELFLNETMRFTEISRVVESALDEVPSHPADSLEIILDDDRRAREHAHNIVSEIS